MIAVVILFLLGAVDIETSLSPEVTERELTVGDPIEVVVTLKHDPLVQISPPIVDSLGPFVVLDTESRVTEGDGRLVQQYRIKLAVFETGDVTLPTFAFITMKGETADTFFTEPLPLSITSTLPAEMSDINDLKGPVEYPNRLPYAIGVVVAASAVAFWLLWRFLKRFRQMREYAEPPPPPWIEALIALENIPAKEWIEKGLVKKYYYSLSEILKRYLERRFEFSAVEQTTTEIITHLKREKVVLRDEFTRFFTDSDLVKYAKFMPALDDQRQAIEKARELIDRTKPIPTEVNR